MLVCLITCESVNGWFFDVGGLVGWRGALGVAYAGHMLLCTGLPSILLQVRGMQLIRKPLIILGP